jgi:diguanylate cyclase (GGDEF)-like protein
LAVDRALVEGEDVGLTPWLMRLTDARLEKRFRRFSGEVERLNLIVTAVVVVALDAAIVAIDKLVMQGAWSAVEIQAQASVLVAATAVIVVLLPPAGTRWMVRAFACCLVLAIIIAALIATGSNMPFRGAVIVTAGILVIYLSGRFDLAVVVSVAVVYTAVTIPAWLASGAMNDETAVPFTLAAVVLVHAVGFVEARRSQRERRTLFVQREILERTSTTDDLTGLGNRRDFYRHVERRLAASSHGGMQAAMVLLDLDHFKEINDTLGHQAGDVLLQQVAMRLAGALPQDCALARLGGDEFVALVPAQDDAAAIEQASTLLAALDAPIDVDGLSVHVRASVGVAGSYAEPADRSTLMRRADIAMYHAKFHGGGIEIYTPEQDVHTRDQVVLAGELVGALETDQIVLHYQPKADIVTGEVRAVEALVRWQHPTRGLLQPADFLPLAAQHGLMRRLTLRVFELALNQMALWRREQRHLRVAINLDPASLMDTRFPDDIAALIERAHVPAHDVDLEITEDTIVADPDRILGVITRLAAQGFSFALDDYGTGYSSLAYLRILPVREIKIDRSFVSTMVHNPDDEVIVQSTIDMARHLGFHVVAEGVEDAATWDLLAEHGCHSVQGYFLSRPLSADDLTEWLAVTSGEDAPAADRR